VAPALFPVDPRDHVATALRDLAAGERALGVTLSQDVPRGHKVALRAVAAGETVLKFGFPIGRATRAIAPGEHVHTHNLSTALEASGRYSYDPVAAPEPGQGSGAVFRAIADRMAALARATRSG
jgi:altronate hydrolase